MSSLKVTAFTQGLPQLENTPRVLPGETIYIYRHQHSRRNAFALHDTKSREAADDNEFGMPGEFSRFLEQFFEIAQFHAHDQGVFWKSAFSHSPKDAIRSANSPGGNARSSDQRLI